jgi:isoleucyl-tRNA synthetase
MIVDSILSALGQKIDGELERLRASCNTIADDVSKSISEPFPSSPGSRYEKLRTHSKWVRGFSFLRDHIDRFEKTHGKPFTYDSSLRSANMMDRWMLSRCQSLIKRLEEKSQPMTSR